MEILQRLDEERRNLVRSGEIADRTEWTTRRRDAKALSYNVTFSRLTGENAADAIDAEIAYHQTLGVGFEWKLYEHDTPPNLGALLGERGFEREEREAVLVLDLSSEQEWIEYTSTSVIQVDEGNLDLFQRTAEAIFGKSYGFTTEQLRAVLRAGSTDHLAYLAFAGNEVASIGRLYTHPESHFGGLYGGGTLPEYRGRGHYRALTAMRAHAARELGARYLIVDALPTSRPILEKLGFELLTWTWPYNWACPK